MKTLKSIHLFLLMILCMSLNAQRVEPFKKDDRVVFVGNSITHAGRYHQYIWLYYMTRFPDMPLTIMNAGIGGEVAGQMFDRLNTDVYSRNPTVIALTFGMNDTGYFEFLQSDSAKTAKERLDRSYQALLKIEHSFKKHPGIKKILIAGSPYDETSKFSSNNIFPGKSDALLKVASFQEAIAKKDGWGFVDFTRPMTEINLREQSKDAAYTLIGNDRIHPGADGHLIMAYLFLKAQGLVNKKVADFTVNATTSKADNQTNCTISNIQFKSGSLQFDYLAKALPFPTDTTATGDWGAMQRRETDALELIPFDEKVNEELLHVSGLENKKYSVEIDGYSIGVWSGADLNTGINLAKIRRTPQYEQAMVIKKLNEERWQIERRFRDYAWMQYDFLKEKDLLGKDDFAALDTIYANAGNGFVKGNINNYLNARYPDVRTVWQKQADLLQQEIYQLNKPKRHRFVIRGL